MSRVYDALRQSELETGIAPALLDPDTFLSQPIPAEPTDNLSNWPPAQEAADQGGTASLAWGEIRSIPSVVGEQSRIITLSDSDALGSEKFRLLRARLRNMRERRSLQKLVITSAVPNEGKSFVAMNLAVCLAKQADEKVLLLEGDLRKPTIGEQLAIRDLPGIGEWASGDGAPSKFLYRFDGLQLWVLPAGSAPENPVTILQSSRFLDLYRQLSICFDWIIIDAPPLLPMADVSFWSRHADGLLLVVRQGKTPKMVLQKGLETLDNPKLVGVVLNDAHDVNNSYYHRYYHVKEKDSK